MQSITDTDGSLLYLGPDNEQEWSRLRRAIKLTEGFALHLISVQDPATTTELIRRLQYGLSDRATYHLTAADKTKLDVAELLQAMANLSSEALVILSGLDEHGLPTDFWVRFNERRNLWQRHSPYVHLWFVNSNIRQQIRTQAPDIYSIRSPDFLFTLPPSTQERFSERVSVLSSPWMGTADSLLAEANLFATDQTPTGRLLYCRALVSVAQRLRFEDRLNEALQIIRRGLALAQEQTMTDLQATFLFELGVAEHRFDQLSEAQAHYEEALSLYRQETNVIGEANTLQALGDLKLRLADLAGARVAYEAALPIYRVLQTRLGEANTLLALGDLKLRLADLVGARADYEAALPIYRTIQMRLGEANCQQCLGNLLAAEGRLKEAMEAMLAALTIHLDIRDTLSCGSDLGFLGRVLQRAASHKQAILCFEETIHIYRAIHKSFDQALALWDQGQSLRILEEKAGALAALWQARDIFHTIQDSSAAALDALFAQLEQQDPENYSQFMAELQTRAEEIRQEAVTKVREAAGDAPLIQQIHAAVRKLLASEDQAS